MKKSFFIKLIMVALIILATFGATSGNYERTLKRQKALYESEIHALKTQHSKDSLDIAMYKNFYELEQKTSAMYKDFYETEQNYNRRLINILRRY